MPPCTSKCTCHLGNYCSADACSYTTRTGTWRTTWSITYLAAIEHVQPLKNKAHAPLCLAFAVRDATVPLGDAKIAPAEDVAGQGHRQIIGETPRRFQDCLVPIKQLGRRQQQASNSAVLDVHDGHLLGLKAGEIAVDLKAELQHGKLFLHPGLWAEKRGEKRATEFLCEGYEPSSDAGRTFCDKSQCASQRLVAWIMNNGLVSKIKITPTNKSEAFVGAHLALAKASSGSSRSFATTLFPGFAQRSSNSGTILNLEASPCCSGLPR